MADTNTGGDAAEQNAGAPAEGTENSPTDSQAADQGNGSGDAGADDGDGGDGDDDEDGSDSDDEEEEDTFEDDGADPAVRDSSYFIGLRHGKKAAKNSGKKESEQGKGADDDDGGDDDDEDADGLHPEDAEILEGAIAKAVKPLTDKLAEGEDSKELQAFLTGNPAFKPYEKRIERFMKHPTRKHLPVSTVAMEAVGPEGMIKIGAKMARSADHKKQTTKTNQGGGPRGGGNSKSVWDMPEQDFAAMQNEVRRKA